MLPEGLMNGTSDSEEPHMSGLIETLDDCRQFYLDAIPGSTGEARSLNERKADCFAAMLAEISQWQARRDDPAMKTTGHDPSLALVAKASGLAPRGPYACDDFNALLHRVNRIHDALFPTHRRPARARGAT